MIVECKNCSTRFQLDDERIPVVGIQVRCSRCKQAFFLPHPQASEADVVDALASQALDQVAGAVPEVATDLAGSSLDDLEKFDASRLLDEDEEDWEFNHDVPAGGGAPEVGSGASGSQAPADAPSGLELDDGGAEAAAPDPGSSGSFGSVEDFTSLGDEEEAAEVVDAPGAGVVDSAIGDMIDALSGDGAEESTAFEVDGELGEPEDWNLLGEQLDAIADDASQTAATAAPSKTEAPTRDAGADRPASSEVRSALRRTLRTVATAVGWLAFAGLAAGTLVQGLSRPKATAATQTYALGALQADSVATHWWTVASGETVLAVTASLHNPTASSQPVGGSLAVELLDADGAALGHPAARVTRPLPAEALRTADPRTRAASWTAGAAALARARVPAAGEVPIAAYFVSPPPEARRVRITNAADATSARPRP